MKAPTVTTQSQKKTDAEMSLGRFHKTRSPTAKTAISCTNQRSDQRYVPIGGGWISTCP